MTIEVTIFIVLVVFDSLKLLDYSLIVSLVVVEVPIGLFLWFVLGERRRSKIQEVSYLVELAQKFKYLKIHRFGAFPSLFRTQWYYVENLQQKLAYGCPRYIIQLGEWGAISVVKHKNEGEMNKHFRDNGVKNEEREPTMAELSLV